MRFYDGYWDEYHREPGPPQPALTDEEEALRQAERRARHLRKTFTHRVEKRVRDAGLAFSLRTAREFIMAHGGYAKFGKELGVEDGS